MKTKTADHSWKAILILGLIVALNHDVATHIIHHVATGYKGKLRIDVADGQGSFHNIFRAMWIKKVSQPPVMIKNSIKLPRRNNTLYGFAAQIFWLRKLIFLFHLRAR